MDFCMGELILDPNGAYLLFRSANLLQISTVPCCPPPCLTDLSESESSESSILDRGRGDGRLAAAAAAGPEI